MTSEDSTVFIVDADCAVQAAIQTLVTPMGVATEPFSSAEQFITDYDSSKSGCVVIELRLPGMSGLEFLRVLKARAMTLPTIVLTGHADVPAAVDAIQLGAFTLFQKPCRDLLLWDEIRRALAVDARSRETRRRNLNQRSRIDSLTEQERKIMDMIVSGQPNKCISSRLNLSLRTIESRRKDIYCKTGTSCVAELVRFVCEAQQPLIPFFCREITDDCPEHA